MDHVELFVDKYVIIKDDGTPILGAKVEDFTKALRDLIEIAQEADRGGQS